MFVRNNYIKSQLILYCIFNLSLQSIISKRDALYNYDSF
jgi:hypothetical protein